MNYDHRFILDGTNDDNLVVTISNDVIEMEVRVDGDTAELIRMGIDDWIAAIMNSDI